MSVRKKPIKKKNVDSNPKKPKRNIVQSSLLSTAKMLSILADAKKYRTWCGISGNYDPNVCFEGYRLICALTFGVLVDEIKSNCLSELGEDFRVYRANFKGIDYDDLPNYSPSVAKLRSLNRLYNRMKRATDWHELEVALDEAHPIVSNLLDFFRDSVTVKSRIEKSELLSMVVLHSMHGLFDVDDKGRTMFWFHGITSDKEGLWLSAALLPGYVSSFEFIVSRLNLNPEIKQEYDGLEKQIGKYVDRSRQFFKKDELPFLPSYSRYEKKDAIPWLSFHFLNTDKREWLSNYREANHLEAPPNPFAIKKEREKWILQIDLPKVDEPDFFKGRDYESLKKQLDYHLFWYDFSLIDSCGYGSFNGVPAFASITYGYSKLRQVNGVKEPVLVRVFKHPEPPPLKGNRYSYSILIQLTGIFSDSSGWLVFNDCATDFSGQGGLFFRQAKKVIDDLKRIGLVECQEIEINGEIFDQYLHENSFEKKVAEENIDSISRASTGTSTSNFVKSTSTLNKTVTEMDRLKKKNLDLQSRRDLASEIATNIRTSNQLLSERLGSPFSFFDLTPECTLHILDPCGGEEEFTNHIGHLASLIDTDMRIIRRTLDNPDPDWRSVRLLQEWNVQRNSDRIPPSFFSVWKRIARLRVNMPSIHRGGDEFLDLVRSFGAKPPFNYGKLWDKILADASESLIDLIGSFE